MTSHAWSHVADGKITTIRVTFDARPFDPDSAGQAEDPS